MAHRDDVRIQAGEASRSWRTPALALALLWAGGFVVTPASAVTLVPVPWIEAGFDPVPETSFSAIVSCWPDCAGDAGETWVDLGVLSGPRVEFQTGQISFEADIVSRIEGHTWTVGMENIALDLPPLETVETLWILVFAGVFAIFDVPADGQSPVTSIALGGPDGVFWVGRSHSELLGPGGIKNSGSVESFLAGDRITFFATVFFQLEFEQFELWTGLETRCGQTSELVLDDCTQRLQLFQPVLASAVPEPAAGLLAATALAALAGLRARRRRASC